MNLSSSVQITQASSAVVVGTTAVNGAVVDMSCFEGVLFTLAAGTITDGTVVLKAQGGTLADGSDMADLAGTATTLAVTDDNQVAVLDIYKPLFRYVRAVAVRGGVTGAILDGLLAIQYEPKVLPTVNDPATVGATNLVISPALGAA